MKAIVKIQTIQPVRDEADRIKACMERTADVVANPVEFEEQHKVLESIRPFVQFFKKHDKAVRDADASLAKETAPLAQLVVKTYQEWLEFVPEKDARDQTRSHYTDALVSEGAALRTVQRWLSSIQVGDTFPLAMPEKGKAQRKPTLERAKGVVRRAAEDDLTLADLVIAASLEDIKLGDIDKLRAALAKIESKVKKPAKAA